MPKSKGALDITGENIEDLLAYDDLFLDYFNCFLALPVFPQAIFYNRLTGAFEEIDGSTPDTCGVLPPLSPSLHFGPTDAVRDRMLEWARQERLTLFLRAELFRELKLVKLLLRPLDTERQSTSRESSRNIRGYSRASESYISSLSISGDNSGNNNLNDFEEDFARLDYNALYRYQRPGSRALSMPVGFFYDNQQFDAPPTENNTPYQTSSKSHSAIVSTTTGTSSSFRFKDFQEKLVPRAHNETKNGILTSSSKTPGGRRQRTRLSEQPDVASKTPKSEQTRNMSRQQYDRAKSSMSQALPSTTEEAFIRGARALSAPTYLDDYFGMPGFEYQPFEEFFGEAEPEPDGQHYVQFEEEGISEAQTEADVRNMEGRLKMTVQQVKERMLGSHKTFEEFREFLRGTSGEHLLTFWLECENFKDTMEDFDDDQNMDMRNAHFRNIQDKYKLKLTSDALDQITQAATNKGLSHTIFLRTQYDVLRRLRAYWVPRFLIHCEMTKGISFDEDEENQDPMSQPYKSICATPVSSRSSHSGDRHPQPMFPSISLVHSMPVLPEDARDYANRLSMHVYDNSTASLRRMFPRQRSTVSARSKRPAPTSKSTRTHSRSTKERFVLALSADKQAGGPFQRYLSSQEDQSLVDSLLFWQAVTDFGSVQDRSSDRLLRLCHAWAIYNKFLSRDSPHKIELPENETKHLQHCLERAREFMEASIFDHAKILAVEKLEKAWVRFLKEDLKAFLDCRVKTGVESPPSTADAIEITITEYDVVIKRPRPWVRRTPGSTASERARRLTKALETAEDMDESKRAKKRAEALARRKEMERERRKAVRAAYARLRASKRDRHGSDSSMFEDGQPGGGMGLEKMDKIPSILEVTGNKPVMAMFKKYVTEDDDKEINNLIQLYNDLDAYVALNDNKTRKDMQSNYISKLYLDPEGKRYVPLNNDDLAARVADERDRPSSAVLKNIHAAILPRVEEVFKEFMLKRSEELGIEPQNLATITQSELTMRMSSEKAMMSSWDKKRLKGKEESNKVPYTSHSLDKLRELEFTSVKVNVMEGEQTARATRSKDTGSKHDTTTAAHDGKNHKMHVGDGGNTSTTTTTTTASTTTDTRSHQKRPEQKERGQKLKTIAESEEVLQAVVEAGSRFRKGAQKPVDPRDQDVVPPLPHFPTPGSQRPQSHSSNRSFHLPTSRRAKKKHTGRAQPTRDDKIEFLNCLNQSAMGHLTIHMLYFYKYLLKHGEADQMPQIDKDLFFYIEVQKFKDGSHGYSDPELLKGKVQSIVACFLDSVYLPSLQIDLPQDLHQKALKNAQKYLSGREQWPTLFDEAQVHIFKELLFYWAGFKRAISTPVDLQKKPVTKYEKMLKKRLETIENYKAPSSDFSLPSIPEGAVPSFSISLSEGVKFKPVQNFDIDESVNSTPVPDLKDRRGSKSGILLPEGQRSRGSSRKNSLVAR
ncbi:regulator of G-protein signaling 22-like isoform X2 [Physella acuta]|uniref:regulator of G-protein signaling 22-like isoform X2 n=1 Tax=Physella acuta TaxID=109671 RepID=UPI0027DBC7EF|nr:regulator of G-protein signaling 22-like isoform X2 [Physella acuta]